MYLMVECFYDNAKHFEIISENEYINKCAPHGMHQSEILFTVYVDTKRPEDRLNLPGYEQSSESIDNFIREIEKKWILKTYADNI